MIDDRGLPPGGSAAGGPRGVIDDRGLPPGGSAARGPRGVIDAESWSTAFAKAEVGLDDSAHVAAVMAIGDSVTTTPFIRPEPIEITTAAVTVAETPAAKVTVHDALSVEHRRDVAHVTATPVATVTERSGAASAPESIDDEPSDGVVRQMTTAETAPARRAPPGHIPADDRPKDTGGEIAPRISHEPSVDAGPSILIDDLAAAQAAISSVITQAARTKDAANPTVEKVVANVRKDAATFSAEEQAFFRQHETGAVPRQSLEEIDSDPYEKPQGFWDRLLKRKPPKK